MGHRKGLSEWAVLISLAIFLLWAGGSYAGNIGSIEPPPEGELSCHSDLDTGYIGTVAIELGQVAAVPVYIGSDDCIDNYHFEFVLPTGLDFDSAKAAPGVPAFDLDVPYIDPFSGNLVIEHTTRGTCMTPNSQNVFLTLYFNSHCKTIHNTVKSIGWGANNSLGHSTCDPDPISVVGGSITINPISITFDISEETALIGDVVEVTVNCYNSYLFDQFDQAWLRYDATVLEPETPFLVEMDRTQGGLNSPMFIGNQVKVYGTKAGGYGTSNGNGAAFYKMRFRVISPIDGVTGLISWVPIYLHTYGTDCHQDLNGLSPTAVFYSGGSVTVPAYRALVDIGDGVGSNHSDCDSIKVPIYLTNNYQVNGFRLVVDYGDLNDANWELLGVVSADPLNWPLNPGYQVCPTGNILTVTTVGTPTYPVSATPVKIGTMIFRYTSSMVTPVYTLQVLDIDCAPYNDQSFVSTNDIVRTTTSYTMPAAQFDAASGTVTIGTPAAQVSIPAAQARWRKIGGRGFYEGWAFSGINVKSNVDIDSVWFTLFWDASKFCVSFQNVSPNALVIAGNSTAYIRVSNVRASTYYQQFGTIRVDNNANTDQSGTWTLNAPLAKDMCYHNPISAAGAGGGIYVGPGGSTACAIQPQAQSLMKGANVPEHFELLQNYPNPFNASTVINFDLTEPGQTTLEIFNIMGQRVAKPFDAYTDAGRYSIRWDGRDERGQTTASGVYLYRLQSGKMVATKKMVILK